MPLDYKHKQTSARNDGNSVWKGMLIGLLLGLSVAVAVYLCDHRTGTKQVATTRAATAATQKPHAKVQPAAEEPPLVFYDRLRTLEVVIPENERRVNGIPEQKKGEKP